VTDKDGKVTTYTYDQLNQLVRVDDQKIGLSTTYSYDLGGNITAVKTYAYTTEALGEATVTGSYTYGNDSGWKDLLTSYNGQDITYDAIGNPLAYRDGMNFTWEGRQLKTAVANKKNVGYTYNSDGIRTNKTVIDETGSVTTNYFLDGSTIIAQKTNSDVLWFLYDSDGTRVGFTYNDASYYYTKNAQGDITGIVDENCNTIVEYSYDAWGKLLSTTGSMADTVGQKNPFLYRGYYYDSETGLYYLNSRYYDPQTGRFINADSQLNTGSDLTSYNLFTYCGNNPITGADPTGHDWIDRLLDKVCGWFGFDSGFEAAATGKYADMYKVTSSFYMGIQTDNTYFSMNYAQLLNYSMQSAAQQDAITAKSYPPNDGFTGSPQKTTLQPGTQLQRNGGTNGTFVAPRGTPTPKLSLPPDTRGIQVW
jgi:RHS repeat-associated core domain